MSAKLCKYDCGTMITWDTAKSIFVEADGTSHSKERCGSLKEKKQAGVPSAKLAQGQQPDGIKDLAAAVRELAAAIRSRPV